MLLTIHEEPHLFIPIDRFRTAVQLPHDFGVSLFVPRNEQVLAKVDASDEQLRAMRRTLLNTIPHRRPADGWFNVITILQNEFRKCLYTLKLQPTDIETAVAGFGQVIEAFIEERARARAEKREPLTFQQAYLQWLDSTVEVSPLTYPYAHQSSTWDVQPVSTAYGCTGMIIHTGDEKHYVHDTQRSCPAENFMIALLRDVTGRIAAIDERTGEAVSVR